MGSFEKSITNSLQIVWNCHRFLKLYHRNVSVPTGASTMVSHTIASEKTCGWLVRHSPSVGHLVYGMQCSSVKN